MESVHFNNTEFKTWITDGSVKMGSSSKSSSAFSLCRLNLNSVLVQVLLFFFSVCLILDLV